MVRPFLSHTVCHCTIDRLPSLLRLQVNVKCIVETMGREHSEQLRQKLLGEGYELAWDLTGLGVTATYDEKEN